MNKKRVFTIACLFVTALFSLHEIFLNCFNHISFARVVLKFLMSFIPFGLAYFGWKSNKNKLNFFITLGLFAYCVADAAINIVLILGIVLYLFGHLFFIRAFLSIKKPVLIQYLCWGVFSIAVFCFIYFIPDVDYKLKVFTAVYILFVTAMATLSFGITRKIFAGGLIFWLSDILLIINIAAGFSDGLAHIFSLGIYYVAVLLLASEVYLSEK